MAIIETKAVFRAASDIAGILSLNYNKNRKINITTTTGETVDLTTGGTEIVSTGETKSTFVYVSNNGSTNKVELKTVGGVKWGVIEPGDWTFVTVPAGVGLSIYSSASTTQASYLTMTRST